MNEQFDIKVASELADGTCRGRLVVFTPEGYRFPRYIIYFEDFYSNDGTFAITGLIIPPALLQNKVRNKSIRYESGRKINPGYAPPYFIQPDIQMYRFKNIPADFEIAVIENTDVKKRKRLLFGDVRGFGLFEHYSFTYLLTKLAMAVEFKRDGNVTLDKYGDVRKDFYIGKCMKDVLLGI